ncbi:MAG TPA: two-component regulator propeller domain-containing protein [Dinghuibacter sp.]|uniref:ligand-binding sensor domain-containing protein n=1 Tax=Dinghuibacter sp. TaxID=2024697 RepID=UPI002C75A043|nr:two-component regulator propeller domain-containing protein [Dinghuibacter sp.]HTJ10887.1 two-component regulator propeller domain-containing protein [Dinghuibacter sp.]
MRFFLLVLLLADVASAQELLPSKMPYRDLPAFCLCRPDSDVANENSFYAFTDSLGLLPEFRQGRGTVRLQLVVDSAGDAQAISYMSKALRAQVDAIAAYLVNFHRWNRTAFSAFTVVVQVDWNRGEIRWNFQPPDLAFFKTRLYDAPKPVIENKLFSYPGNPRKRYNVTVRDKQNDGLSDDYGTSVAVDRQGFVWEGTTGGVSRLHDDQVRTYLPPEEVFVGALVADKTGNKWMTDFKKLYLYDDKVWTVFDSSVTGLSWVRSIVPIADGRVMVAGYGGVATYDKGTWTTKRLPDNNVYFAAPDSKGRLWVGTSGGTAVIGHDSIFLSPSIIDGMTEDAEGNCWFATSDGLAEYSVTGHWLLRTAQNSGMPSGHVNHVLYNPHDNSLWMSIQHVGVCRWDILNDWLVITRENSPFPSTEATGLALDQEGNVWCATHEGLVEVSAVK